MKKLSKSQRKMFSSVILRPMLCWNIRIRKLVNSRWISGEWHKVYSDGVGVFEKNEYKPYGQFKEVPDWWAFFFDWVAKRHPNGDHQIYDMLPVSVPNDVKLNKDHPWVKEIL